MTTPINPEDNTVQSLAEQSAENLLTGMEVYARDLGVCVHLLDLYRLDYDDLAIQHKVEVRQGEGESEYRYYATDGWGNLEHSTREWVKLRLTQHKERQFIEAEARAERDPMVLPHETFR